jgi:hypothetical protein
MLVWKAVQIQQRAILNLQVHTSPSDKPGTAHQQTRTCALFPLLIVSAEANPAINQAASPTPRHSPADVRLRQPSSIMISDAELYRLAIFLGSAAMVLIILYSFFEVNSKENERATVNEKAPVKTK